MTAGLRADAREHRVQTPGGIRISVTHDGLRGDGNGQPDASPVLRVRGATHQPGVGQPINHRRGGRRPGTQGPRRARSVRVTGASALIRCSTAN